MDHLPAYAEYRRCLHDLDSVSRIVLAHRPTIRFLNHLPAHPSHEPLRILDVACGDGSMLRRIAAWAVKHHANVQLTGVDLNPRAIQVAHEFPPGPLPIDYIVSDVFAYAPPNPPEIILSAHFTHHLPEPALIRFLRWMEATAQRGWFVNDLHRHPNPYRLFRALAAVMPWHPVVIDDGLLSIRRAFTPSDWRGLLAEAAIPGATIAEAFPARITVTRYKSLIGHG